MNDYFSFDDDKRAIRIHRFDTPQPWINYLSNGSFHAFVSQAGGGFAWWKSPVVMRLTRYRQYNLPIDSPGFYIYIRHRDGTVWSPTFRPCETPLDGWEACHQPGKTTFLAQKNGVRAKLTLFVPPDYDALLWDLELSNTNGKAEDLDVFAYVEHSQLNWESEASWGYYSKLQLKTWHDEEAQCVNYLCHCSNPREAEAPLIYLAGDRNLISYSGSRNHFVGDYRSERNPLGVEIANCGNHEIQCGEPASAIHNKISVNPGEIVQTAYILGVADGGLVDLKSAESKRNDILKDLRQRRIVKQQFKKLDSWWSNHFAAFQCELPDPDANRQINTWNVVNSVNTGRYSRSVNTVAPGIRGIGFRDSAQDMLAIAYRKPEWATSMFKFLLSQQYRDGHTVHYAYPEEKKAPSLSHRSDNHLWLPLVAYAILSETGDFSLLDEPVAFIGENWQHPDGQGTVWEHLMAAVNFTENNLGKHNIPLTFFSDWNDIIGRFNERGDGETIFAAMQYLLCLRHLIEMAEQADRTELEHLKDCLKRQETALEACAWDGAWWRRGFDDDGNAVGSVEADCGKLFLNPQSWAVICGLGDERQQKSGMDAVNTTLDTEMGLKILDPAFESWSGEGEAKTGYGPGCGENGAIFCHANTWAVMAEALLGNADRAWKYFTQLIPVNAMKTAGIENYRAEPYAWVSNIVGPGNNRSGWANVEQITGTAPWMDVASTQYLLGIRPTLKGLLIDPCIPSDWKSFKVSRLYRGTLLSISVKNDSGSSKDVKSMIINGKKMAGNLIDPGMLAGKPEAIVEVVL